VKRRKRRAAQACPSKTDLFADHLQEGGRRDRIDRRRGEEKTIGRNKKRRGCKKVVFRRKPDAAQRQEEGVGDQRAHNGQIELGVKHGILDL